MKQRHAPFLAASLFAALCASPHQAQAQAVAGSMVIEPDIYPHDGTMARAGAATSVPASKDLFSGLDLPLSLKPQQLSSQWRQIVVAGDSDNTMMQAMMFGRGGSAPQVYYTRGQTVSMGGQTYLVAYRVKPDTDPNSNMARRRMAMQEEEDAAPPRLAFDAVLALSLLNLRNSGNLENVRAFDPKIDIEKPQQRDARFYQQSASNLKQLGLALAQYMADWDEVLPPMNSARSMEEIRRGFRPAAPDMQASNRVGGQGDNRQGTVQLLLSPYARDVEIFRHPGTKEIYRPNLSLSRKKLSAIKTPSKVATFYEAKAALDGRRAVLYLDGHVKRELETDWPRIKKASGIR